MTNTTIEGFNQRCREVLETAKRLHVSKPDWVTFFRDTLGVDGAARSVFAIKEEFLQFEQTKEYEAIQAMVASLRSKKPAKKTQEEDTKVITVRLPESLHEALKAEAAEHRTSMNKLCISKLLQALVEEAANANAAEQNRIANAGISQPVAGQAGFSIDPQPMQTEAGFRSTYQSDPRTNN